MLYIIQSKSIPWGKWHDVHARPHDERHPFNPVTKRLEFTTVAMANDAAAAMRRANATDFRVIMIDPSIGREWSEYDSAADWCAARKIAGKPGDPLPQAISLACAALIDADPEAFERRVKEYAYARAMPVDRDEDRLYGVFFVRQ